MSFELWATLVVGVLTTILTIFFYVRSRRKPGYDPVYLRSSDNSIPLGELSPSDIVQLVNEGRIERLARTVLVLWNKGLAPLLASHVPPNHPVTIAFPDKARILRYKILRTQNKGNELSIEPTGTNELSLKFHHLNHNDGIAIELIHASAHRYPAVRSFFVGLSCGFRDLGNIYSPRPDFAPSDFLMRGIIAVLMFLLAAHGVMSVLFPRQVSSIYAGNNFDEFRIGFYWLGAVGMFWFPRLLRTIWKERRRCPKGLDVTGKFAKMSSH